MTLQAAHCRRRARAALWMVALALSQILLPACGKKGPPLAPLVRVPGRPEPAVIRRLGSMVYLQVKVPDHNQDGSSPADIVQLEIYGYTGEPKATADVFKYGTLMATLPVRRPPEPEPAPAKKGKGAEAPPPRRAPAARPAAPGYDQGAVVVVTETLGPEQLRPVILPGANRFTIAAAKPLISPPMLGPPPGDVPGRTYIVVGVNHHGQRGAPTGRLVVPLGPAPQSPTAPALAYIADRFTLSWQPPVMIRRPVQAPATGGVLQAVPRVEVLPASAYNVYEVGRKLTVPPAGESPGSPPAVLLPLPVNDQPLAAPTFEDSRFAFGVERCYVVRTVDTFGPGKTAESEPSAVACVTPRDTFPPAAPKGLQAVAGDGTVSLIWEPGTEADLAGYLVMRGLAPGGALERLTPEPIRETTYSDTTAKAGTRYIYAVVAVDAAVPPNVSARSNTVEVLAR